MTLARRFALRAAFVVLAALSGCTSVPLAVAPDSARSLAPTGALRVGLYPGTPTSLIGEPGSPAARGVGFDLGRALAATVRAPFMPVVYPRNADVLAAARAGAVDVVFTNATAARRQELDFSPTVLEVELGYLVPAASPLQRVDDIDRPGLRIGVSEGSTSQGVLSARLRNVQVVTTPSLQAATEMLASGRLDAFATNKPTLYEMADRIPGARVLDGQWGVESFAIGIPKGRAAALPLLARFVEEARARGVVSGAVARAGLRGAVP